MPIKYDVIKYTFINDVNKYATINEVIKYAITNDLIKYGITNDVIKKKIKNISCFQMRLHNYCSMFRACYGCVCIRCMKAFVCTSEFVCI